MCFRLGVGSTDHPRSFFLGRTASLLITDSVVLLTARPLHAVRSSTGCLSDLSHSCIFTPLFSAVSPFSACDTPVVDHSVPVRRLLHSFRPVSPECRVHNSRAVLSALSTNPLIARILVWLALGLEGLIAFVLLYISFRFPSGTHSRRSKRSDVKGKGEGNDSTVETGTPVSAETGRKKPRKERKARTKNARKGENRRVTPSVFNTEAGATADAGSSEPEQKDSRLRFPSIDDVPDLPAVGVHKGQGRICG